MAKKDPKPKTPNPDSAAGDQNKGQDSSSDDEKIECLEKQQELLINNPVFQEKENEACKKGDQNEKDQEEDTKAKTDSEVSKKFSKNFVEYMKTKVEDLRKEASTLGEGKVGKKTKFVSGLVIILPTIIAGCLMSLPEQSYKTLVAGGFLTIISGIAACFLKGCKWLINHSLGRWHRKRAKTIIQKLDAGNFLSNIVLAEDEEFLKSEADKIFCSYQNQFQKVNDEFGIIEKLAVDAVDRIMNYLATGSSTRDDDFITKGVVFGKSKMIWVRRGKTVKFDHAKCNTGDFYSKVDALGIRFPEFINQREILLNGCRRCTPAKYGWRYLFSWEMTEINNLTNIDIVA